MKQAVVLLLTWLLQAVQSQVCEFCADGSAPSVDLDAVLFTTGDEDVTCRSLQATITELEADTVSCTGYQELTAVYCGCPRPEASCTLCPDGSIAPDPDREIVLQDQTATTCRDYIQAAPGTPDSACSLIQQTIGVERCGCPAAPASQGPSCTICPSGSSVSVTLPDRTILGITCSEFEAQVPSQFEFVMELCRAVQLTSGLYCGCPDIVVSEEMDVCRICGANQELQSLDALVTIETSQGVSEQKTCFALEFDVIRNPTLCESYQMAAADKCCTPSTDPTPAPAATSMPASAPTVGGSSSATTLTIKIASVVVLIWGWNA